MSSSGAHRRGSPLGFLLRHWAPVLVAILLVVLLFTGWMMWRAGLPTALNLLPQFAICIALIVAVLVVRHVVGRLTAKAVLGSRTRQVKEQAQEAVSDGLDKGKAILTKGAAEAREALDSVSHEVEGSLDQLARSAGTGADVHLPAVNCARCGHAVRAGARFCASCGAPLPGQCPHCRQALRPGARFCDSCGKAIAASH